MDTRNSSKPFTTSSLYVGDLSPQVTEAQLFEQFNVVGPVSSIRVCRDSRSRRSLGYAYVNFHSLQDAEKALNTMNFQPISGHPCRIMWSQRDPKMRQSNKGNIFVKNLHESIDNKTLYDTFDVFGKILSCKVAIDKMGKSLGYGYVHYVTEKSAKEAIKGVNGMRISGRKVEAELFRSRSERKKNGTPIYTNVYVKYIPKTMKEDKLKEIFEKEVGGTVTHMKFWILPFGISACLNWETTEQAQKAVELFNGRKFEDEATENKDEEKEEDGDKSSKESSPEGHTNLYVARAQKRAERDRDQEIERRRKANDVTRNQQANLYVKNIDTDLTKEELYNVFKDYGKITSACIMKETDGRSRGFGFVQFHAKDSAVRAKSELNGKMFRGRPLYVSVAQTKEYRASLLQRTRSRGGYTNRNYGGGRYNKRRDNRPVNYNIQHPNPNTQMFNQQGYPNQFMQQQYAAQFNPNRVPMQTTGQFTQPNPLFNSRPIGVQMQPYMNTGPGPHSMTSGMASGVNPMQSFQNQQTGIPQSGFNQNIRQPNSTSIMNYQNSQSRGNININTNVTGINNSQQQTQQPPQSSVQQLQQGSSIPIQQGQNNSQQQTGGAQSNTNAASEPSQQTSAPIVESVPLTTAMLQKAKPAERKRLIGERLFPKIQVVEPRLAGKITGMLLEMDNTELLVLLTDQQALMTKINEALAVLKDHQQKQSQSNVASGGNSSNPNKSQPNRGSAANRGSQSNQNTQVQ